MTTPPRRLTALIVFSVVVHLLALAWLTRPVALPLSLPTLEVLLVSPRDIQSPSAPDAAVVSELADAGDNRARQREPTQVQDNAGGSAAAGTQRRTQRQAPPGSEPLANLNVPDIDHSRSLQPPQPAVAMAAPSPARVDGPAVSAGVILAIRQQLARYQAYPASARRRGLEGAATVRFVISRGGELMDAELLQSSGSRHLDQAAMKLVSDAAPYPPLPGVIGASRLEVKIPIEYRLTPPAT